jgi:hypothetical protein
VAALLRRALVWNLNGGRFGNLAAVIVDIRPQASKIRRALGLLRLLQGSQELSGLRPIKTSNPNSKSVVSSHPLGLRGCASEARFGLGLGWG